MSTTASLESPTAQVGSRAESASAHRAESRVPWYLWAVVFASTSVVVGVMWDISWHRTIGRDTFWTPAHMAIYLGGVTAGLACGFLVLRTTFARSAAADRAGGVTFWGFRGPLGAWVAIWGALAMVASAPFDDWWHNAYGLDVKILSPPHTVLASGIIAIQVGAMLMVLARQNTRGDSRLLEILFTYAGGVLLLMMATLGTEYIGIPNDQHGSIFFMVSAGLFPVFLVGISRGSPLRWGAAIAALLYMFFTVSMIWILQLFRAQPLLGPVLRPVDHMVPPSFPILLVVPAVAVDLLVHTLPARAPRARAWLTTAAAGVAFVLALLAVQWFFSSFLLSEGARNFFFGADQWDYNSAPGPWQYEFWTSSLTLKGLVWAALIGAASARVGLWWGDWMSRVRR